MATMGWIKARKRWRVRWRATSRKTRYVFAGSRNFLEKSQALKFYAEIEAQEKLVRSGQVVPNESLTLIVQNFRTHIKRHTLRTQGHYNMVIDKFIEKLPASLIRIHQLEPQHIQNYLYVLRDKGNVNRTINAHLTVIKAFCRFFSERLGIPNPAIKVKLLSEDPPNTRFLTQDEYDKILTVASPLAKQRIIFLANTGLRASEFTALEPMRIDPSGNSITIIGKGRRKRTIPLNRTARSVLPYVKPATKNALWLQFSRIAKKANIPIFGPHALRHYCATQLLLKRVPAATVAKIMGNSVRVLEKHYSHILTADIKNATDVLDSQAFNLY